MDQPITERTQRTERRFTERSGTFADMAARSASRRIWLDNGQQKQAARTIVSGLDDEGNQTISFFLRGAEDKQIMYQCDPGGPVTWYEEIT